MSSLRASRFMLVSGSKALLFSPSFSRVASPATVATRFSSADSTSSISSSHWTSETAYPAAWFILPPPLPISPTNSAVPDPSKPPVSSFSPATPTATSGAPSSRRSLYLTGMTEGVVGNDLKAFVALAAEEEKKTDGKEKKPTLNSRSRPSTRLPFISPTSQRLLHRPSSSSVDRKRARTMSNYGQAYQGYGGHGQQGYGQLEGNSYGQVGGQGGGYGGQGYGQHQAQNPFASEVDLHAPGSATYPPTAQQGGSSWSLEEEPFKNGAASGAAAAGAGVQRSRDNPYAANYKEKGAGVKKWIWIGVAILVVAAIAIGIAVWRVKANDSDSSSSSSSSSGKLQYINGTAKVVKSNPNDPSDFERDPRLKQIFWAMAYTPKNVLEEYGCGSVQVNVTEDVQLLSQLTTRLRTYSTSCNQTAMLLQAIQDTKVNMTVTLGAYVGDNTTVNAQQQEDILDALQTYGADHVTAVTIGNEYILGQTDQATAITYINSQVAAFNESLLALNLGKKILVGTADAGSVYTATLAEGIDAYYANVHPWFGGVNIDDAAGWTWEYFTNNDQNICDDVGNSCFIAETGWPTASMTLENATYKGAVAGVSELQTFLNTYPCQANKNESHYYYFEPFDEPWKERYGGVEPYWGLFDSNKILKDITFPDCDVDSSSSSG
ncbi:hypothetical protein JCM8547_003158 [Rhodosporidiobolus lusitaniae]